MKHNAHREVLMTSIVLRRSVTWHRSVRAAILFVSAASVASCNRAPAPIPPLADYQVLSASAYSEACQFCAVPDAIRDCEADTSVVRLHWRARDSSVQMVSLSMLVPGEEEKPFAEHGPVGALDVDPPIRPGQVFRLREGSTGRLLAELTIAGVGC